MRVNIIAKLMSKKTHSSSRSPASPSSPRTPSSRSPSPPPSEDGFVVVARSGRRRLGAGGDWQARRAEVHRDMRVLEYELLLVAGCMRGLDRPEVMERNCYFGRYGPVKKVIVSAYYPKAQAFITYHNQLDTAFAVAALCELKHHPAFAAHRAGLERERGEGRESWIGHKHHVDIKAHYGTTRYCEQFIAGRECHAAGCFFNHRVRENHLHKNDLHASEASQYARAYALIADNLEYFAEKVYREFKNQHRLDREENCCCARDDKQKRKITFPSCREVMQKLVQDRRVDAAKYEAAKNKIKARDEAHRHRTASLHLQDKENKAATKAEGSPSPAKKPQEASALVVVDTAEAFPALLIKLPPGSTAARPLQEQLSMPRRVDNRHPETLEQYIEDNILSEPAVRKLKPMLSQRMRAERPFRGEKMGDVVGRYGCELQGLNPELDACQYLISRIMRKTMTGNKISRLPFVGVVDVKTQAQEERRLRDIIGKKLVN